MGKYGQAALKAVALVTGGKTADPADAWRQATIPLFGKGTEAQRKSCPRDAFLGCCEAGFVKGIKPGNYTRSTLNKLYAVTAAHILKINPSLANLTEIDLWKKVLSQLRKATSKTHNDQMHVVLTLFRNKLLI